MNRRQILEKIAGLQLREAADELLGKTNKIKGLAAIGIPSAYMYHSVAKSNARNPSLSRKQAITDSVKTGLGTGFLDGATLAALHHENKSIKMPKKVAIFGAGLGVFDGAISGIEAARQTRHRKD